MIAPGMARERVRPGLTARAGEGGRVAHAPRAPGTAGAVLALQRQAGNAAVTALLSAQARSPTPGAGAEINAALTELRGGDPSLAPVERGLRAAKALGVPVQLEGPKPAASALAVVRTGFGPEKVAPKKAPQPAGASPRIASRRRSGGMPGRSRPGPGRGRRVRPAGAGPAAADLAPTGSALIGDRALSPPVPPTGMRPRDDPAFKRVTRGVRTSAASARAHPSAADKAREAQAAAVAPPDDVAAQAKAAKVDTMDAQQPGEFDRKAFIAAVKAAVEAKSPKTLKEADGFSKSGRAGQVKGEVKGMVDTGTKAQAKDLEAATQAPPDQSKAVPKPVTALRPESPGVAPQVPATGAAPKPAPPEQLNLQAGPHAANAEMADAGVTEAQLAESKEPAFEQALADKRAAAAHAETAPAQYRAQERAVLQQGRAQASEATAAGIAGMQGSKAAAVAGLVADKEKTKTKDEAKRAQVTAKVEALFAATEADVKKILTGIDPKVDAEFTRGEAAARRAFESYVAVKMAAYKADRYSGALGGLRWAKDKLLGMPAKVNEFFEAGRERYLAQMNEVISRVATIVGNGLTAAKRRIAKGRADIATYVKSLPADLKKVGAEASQEIGERFEQLTASVDAKQESVVDTLATKYVEARTGLDERIEALQAENKGLVDKAIGAIKGVINTIRELAAMLRNALQRAASAVGEIVRKPVKFLKNLIAGVKGGILRFKDNILAHLKKGLMGWLFGALAAGGIQLPDKFDLKGVVTLLASIFGLTWRNIRQRVVRKIGERVMGAVEKGVDIFAKLASEGVGGLWQMLVEKVGDLKEMILEKAQDFVITKIITAGITWLISLLNPASAFVKACKLIYDIVMFFVNNARRIVQFVTTVIDSFVDVVRGNVSGVVSKIENALGQMVPILIGFLASVLGIGGIGEKIREIVSALRKPVNKALDFIIKTGLKLAGPVIRGLKGLGGKAKAKIAAGKAWVKGKAQAGKAWVKAKVAAAKEFLSFRRKFTVEGESHNLYTTPGSDALVVASTPTELDQHPDTAVRKAYTAYRRAVDPAKTAAAKKRVSAKPLQDILAALRAWLKRTKGKDPQASAPGIGNIALYRNQPSSLRTDIPVWALEREHVVPRAFANAMFKSLNLKGIPAGKSDYRAQTTIMIYKGAAAQKTHGPDADNATSDVLKGDLAAVVDEYHKTKASQKPSAAGLVVDSAIRLMGWYSEDAIERTAIAVEHENRRNGARRGKPESPEQVVPSHAKIEQAAHEQMQDINRQLKARLQ
jgi:hypothetical protein